MEICFAIKRGEIKGRFDPKFFVFGGYNLLKGTDSSELGKLTIKEPEYGSGERATPIESPTDIKYIRITDFDDYGIVPNNKFVTAERISKKYLLENEDVLFARTGATVGKTYIHDQQIGKSIFAGYCIRFRFDKSKVLPWFVYFYTKTPRYQRWIKSIQRPAGQPNINKEEFKSFTIPVPSIGIQQKLVGNMQTAQENRKQKLVQADNLLTLMDQFLYEQIGLNFIPSNNPLVFAVKFEMLKEEKKLHSDYYHPERVSALKSIQSCTNILSSKRLGEIVNFVKDINASVADSKEYFGLASVESNTGELASGVNEEAEGQCHRFLENDILFAKLRPYLNKVYRAEMNGVCSPEFHVIRIKLCELKVIPEYLAAVLRSSAVVKQTKHMMTGNTHPRLANDDVTKLFIPIPEEKVQDRIVKELKSRRVEARRLREEAEAEWCQAKISFESQLLGKETAV